MFPLLAAIGISLAVSLGGVFLLRRYLIRSLDSKTTAARLQEEVTALITELNGTTERNVTLAENAVHRLLNLLEKAEKTIVVLERETEKKSSSHRVYNAMGRIIERKEQEEIPPPAPPPEAAPPGDGEHSQENLLEIPQDRDTMRAKVLALHREGTGTERISSLLGLNRGEVELIISLHSREV